MLKITGAFILLFLSISELQSSDKEIFLLKLEHLQNDSCRIDSLNEWAFQYRYENLSLSISLAKKAGELALESSNKEGYALSNYRLGLLYRMKQIPDSSIWYYRTGLKTWRSVENTERIIHTCNAISKVYRIQGAYDSALLYGYEALKVSRLNDDTIDIARSLNKIAIIYELTEEYGKAADIYNNNLRIYQSLSSRAGIAETLANLGNISFYGSNYDSALVYFEKSIELYSKAGLEQSLPGLYNNVGICYLRKNNQKRALTAFLKGVDINNNYKLESGLNDLYVNIGRTFEMLENYPKALDYYKRAAGLSAQNKDLDNESIAWYNLYCVYEKQKNYRMALESLRKHKALQDSVLNREKLDIITDYKTRYEVSEKDAQNLRLENENLQTSVKLKNRTLQRNTLLGSSFTILVTALILLLWYRSKTKRDRLISQQKIKQLHQEKDLLAARYIVEGQEEERKRVALELHDGVGVLLSTAKMQFTTFIRNIRQGDSQELIDKAYKLIEKASGEIRKVSYKMMPGILSHFGLEEAVKDLFGQVEDSTGIRTTFEYENFEERLNENREVMIYRILQELVNNTVKHAGAKQISFSMVRKGDNINIAYSDDGKGFNPDETMRKQSLGLKNITSRIRFLNGEHTIESFKDGGMIFSAEVPADQS